MKEDEKQITDVDELNRKYYKMFNELKNARPALSNCDAAFLSFVQNITEQYHRDSNLMKSQLFNEEGETDKSWERMEKFKALIEQFSFIGERLKANTNKIPEGLFALMNADMENEYRKMYELFTGEYDPEMDRKIAKQKALHARIVPKRDLTRRFLLFFKKPAQNYAADLIDMEEDEKALKIFAKQKAEIDELYADRIRASEPAAEDPRADETQETSPKEQEGQEEPAEDPAQDLAEQGGETPQEPAEELVRKLVRELIAQRGETPSEPAEEPTVGEEGEEAEPPQEGGEGQETEGKGYDGIDHAEIL